MKIFVRAMDQTGLAFRYLAEKFSGIGAVNIIVGSYRALSDALEEAKIMH
jgi:hypothetical protein